MCTLSITTHVQLSDIIQSYEERSLGVFEEPPDEEDEEPADLNTLEPRQRIGRYVGWHLRRQISIGTRLSYTIIAHRSHVILRYLVAGMGRLPGRHN